MDKILWNGWGAAGRRRRGRSYRRAGQEEDGYLFQVGAFLPWLGRASVPAGAAVAIYEALDSIPHAGYESALKDNPNLFVDMERDRRLRPEFPGGLEGGMHTVGAGLGPKPGSWDGAVADAKNAGQEIQSALSVQATPIVNVAQLERAVALAKELKGVLSTVGTAVSSETSQVTNAMNRNFADHGVKP